MSVRAMPVTLRRAKFLRYRLTQSNPTSTFDIRTVSGEEYAFVRETREDGVVVLHGAEPPYHNGKLARRALERFHQARRHAFEGRQSYFPHREA